MPATIPAWSATTSIVAACRGAHTRRLTLSSKLAPPTPTSPSPQARPTKTPRRLSTEVLARAPTPIRPRPRFQPREPRHDGSSDHLLGVPPYPPPFFSFLILGVAGWFFK